MLNQIRDLYKNKDLPQARIKILMIISNIILLFVHFVFLIFYFIINSRLMINFSLISTILYIYLYYNACYKEKIGVHSFSNIALFQVLFNIILAVLAFGSKPGFHNWVYALICAFFLPIATSRDNKRPKYIYFFGIIYTITYYLLIICINKLGYNGYRDLGSTVNDILFFFNTSLAFIVIFVFTYFYTSTYEKRIKDLTFKMGCDELTGIYNRYAIRAIMEESSKDNFLVAILDIDFFKKVNDKYGHNAGDYILKKLAERLKKLSIFGINYSRWGGEEFLLFTHNKISNDEFYNILNKFKEEIENTKFKYKGKTIKITLSAGIAKFKTSIDATIDHADKNLYTAKSKGRNIVINDNNKK